MTLTQAFVKLLRERNDEAVSTWLAQAQAGSIREFYQFAQDLERYRADVEAAFSRTENNGIVEGQCPPLAAAIHQLVHERRMQ